MSKKLDVAFLNAVECDDEKGSGVKMHSCEPKVLINAIEKYNSDSNRKDLYKVYKSCILKRQKQFEKENIVFDFAKAFNTFNFAPKVSYHKYLSSVANLTDYGASKSDWDEVGVLLNLAMIKILLEKNNSSIEK